MDVSEQLSENCTNSTKPQEHPLNEDIREKGGKSRRENRESDNLLK